MHSAVRAQHTLEAHHFSAPACHAQHTWPSTGRSPSVFVSSVFVFFLTWPITRSMTTPKPDGWICSLQAAVQQAEWEAEQKRLDKLAAEGLATEEVSQPINTRRLECIQTKGHAGHMQSSADVASQSEPKRPYSSPLGQNIIAKIAISRHPPAHPELSEGTASRSCNTWCKGQPPSNSMRVKCPPAGL